MLEENQQLQMVNKSAVKCVSLTSNEDSSENEETNSGDNSLSDQLTNSAQARALKLELENRRLLSAIDSLKEHDFQEFSSKVLELEKEKKKMTLKCGQLQDRYDHLTQQNIELENLFKNSIQVRICKYF